MSHNTQTSFSNPLTLASAERLLAHDYEVLRTNQVYLDSNTTQGISPATSTAATVSGNLVFSTGGPFTITSVANVFTFTVALGAGGISSLANTTAGSTISTSVILQNGSFVASSLNSQTFHLTNTGIQSVANTSSGSTITGSVILQPGAGVGITVSGQTFNFTGTIIQSLANTATGSTVTGSVILQGGANVAITISGSTFNFTSTAAGGVASTAPAFNAYLTADQSLASATDVKLSLTTENFDIGGMYGAASAAANPPTTGIYLFGGAVSTFTNTLTSLRLYRNASLYANLQVDNQKDPGNGGANGSVIVEVTATTDYYQLYTQVNATATAISGEETTYFYGYRIGDRA